MYKQLITTVLLLVTYRVNYLSSSGQLGENLMRLREIFPFPYMPAGRTFAVARTAIYLALGVRCIRGRTKKGRTSEVNNKVLPRFRISSILNIVRIYFTAREWYVLSVGVIILLMFTLWSILKIVNQFRHKNEFHRGAVVTRNAFGLYAGRITMATTIVGISQVVYILITNDRPLTMRWTVMTLCGGTAVALRVYRTYRNPSQLLITLVALAGVMSSILG